MKVCWVAVGQCSSLGEHSISTKHHSKQGMIPYHGSGDRVISDFVKKQPEVSLIKAQRSGAYISKIIECWTTDGSSCLLAKLGIGTDFEDE